MTTRTIAPRMIEEPLPGIDAPTVIVVINRLWNLSLSDDEVYQATRGSWKIGEAARSRAEFVLGVAGGVVRGAYRIKRWCPSQEPGRNSRWDFEGESAADLDAVGKSVRRLQPPRGAANPVRLYLDGIPEPEKPSVLHLADALDREPLARIMFGHRELFHSNLLAWFFDTLPEVADRVLGPLAPLGDGSVRQVEREKEHVDLIFRWPGKAPVVIENKVFSLPSSDQLARIRKSTERWVGTPPSHYLLSMVEPDWSRAPVDSYGNALVGTFGSWSYFSYEQLADRLEIALENEGHSYEVDTMRRYSRVIRLLSSLIEATTATETGYSEPIWPSSEFIGQIKSRQLRAAVLKLRGYRLAALANRHLGESQGSATAGMTNSTPFVQHLIEITLGDHEVSVGWQVQGSQFRRFMVIPHLSGTSKKMQEQRAVFAGQYPELFSFNRIRSALNSKDVDAMPKDPAAFLRFNPDFVYRYLKVPNLSVDQFLSATSLLQEEMACYKQEILADRTTCDYRMIKPLGAVSGGG